MNTTLSLISSPMLAEASAGELAVSIVAAIIALAALFLSIHEGIQSRRHDRLSVRPYLENTLRMPPAYDRFALSVSNSGLGPAIITSWKMLVDGRAYKELGFTRWEELTKYLGLNEKVNYTAFQAQDILTTNRTEELVGVERGTYDSAREAQFRAAVRRLTIAITILPDELAGADVVPAVKPDAASDSQPVMPEATKPAVK